MTASNYCRPLVLRFACAMEDQLRANDHKPGWQKDSPIALCDRAQQELDELFDAISARETGGASDAQVKREAADAANFAMMIWDVITNNPSDPLE